MCLLFFKSREKWTNTMAQNILSYYEHKLVLASLAVAVRTQFAMIQITLAVQNFLAVQKIFGSLNFFSRPNFFGRPNFFLVVQICFWMSKILISTAKIF